MPSEDEITRIRRLISRKSPAAWPAHRDERDQTDRAVAAVRRHRATMLGMPRTRPAAIEIRPENTA